MTNMLFKTSNYLVIPVSGLRRCHLKVAKDLATDGQESSNTLTDIFPIHRRGNHRERATCLAMASERICTKSMITEVLMRWVVGEPVHTISYPGLLGSRLNFERGL